MSIVVASVSCIYGIGSKEDYEAMVIPLRVGLALSREQFLSRMVDLQYYAQRHRVRARQFPRARRHGGSLARRPRGRIAHRIFRRRQSKNSRASSR